MLRLLALLLLVLASPSAASPIVEFVPEPGSFATATASFGEMVVSALDGSGNVIDQTGVFQVQTDFSDAGIRVDPGTWTFHSYRTDAADAAPITLTTQTLGLPITIDFAPISIESVAFSVSGDPVLPEGVLVQPVGEGAVGPTHDFVIGGQHFVHSGEYLASAQVERQADGSLLVHRFLASGQEPFERVFQDGEGRSWRVDFLESSLFFGFFPDEPVRFVALVPEPSSLGLLCVVLAAGLARRFSGAGSRSR